MEGEPEEDALDGSPAGSPEEETTKTEIADEADVADEAEIADLAEIADQAEIADGEFGSVELQEPEEEDSAATPQSKPARQLRACHTRSRSPQPDR